MNLQFCTVKWDKLPYHIFPRFITINHFRPKYKWRYCLFRFKVSCFRHVVGVMVPPNDIVFL
jgi:hypothetical protein